jgi:hypothetical protein
VKAKRLGLVRDAGSLIAEKLLDGAKADQCRGGAGQVGVRLGKQLIPQGFEISAVESRFEQTGETQGSGELVRSF